MRPPLAPDWRELSLRRSNVCVPQRSQLFNKSSKNRSVSGKPCFRDHLSITTIFPCTVGWSLKTGFTAFALHACSFSRSHERTDGKRPNVAQMLIDTAFSKLCRDFRYSVSFSGFYASSPRNAPSAFSNVNGLDSSFENGTKNGKSQARFWRSRLFFKKKKKKKKKRMSTMFSDWRQFLGGHHQFHISDFFLNFSQWFLFFVLHVIIPYMYLIRFAFQIPVAFK